MKTNKTTSAESGETAIDILINGAMRATAKHMQNYPKLAGRHAMVAECLKQTLKVKLPSILNEWKNATSANIGEGWLREMVNAQCNEIAIETLNICNAEI